MKDYDPNCGYPAKAKQAAAVLSHIWQSQSERAGSPVVLAISIPVMLDYFHWDSIPKKLEKRLVERSISAIPEIEGKFLVLVSTKNYEVCQLIKL